MNRSPRSSRSPCGPDPLRGARARPTRCARGRVEGYEPAEIRRIWTILSFQRDLGINLAGVEAILKLRDHMAQVHHRLDEWPVSSGNSSTAISSGCGLGERPGDSDAETDA